MKPAIEVKQMWKEYSKGKTTHYLTLRDSLAKLPQNMLGYKRKRKDPSIFYALRNVSFSVQPGEVVGLIGRNGAGKSTLLKVLSRITPPTKGRAILRGRLGSLLEVGTGFHFELTGRENIFLYGAVLGMKKLEIQKKFDEIVAFAEVDDFLDTPLKHYSSGMYLRLAFAVAAHLETEILLVDEVLAVGDSAFQQKSVKKMGEVASEGKTVIFVSHNMSTIVSTCKRSILLENGKLLADGDTETVIKKYLSSTQGGERKQDSPLTIKKIELKNTKNRVTFATNSGNDLILDIYYQAKKPIESPHFIVSINHQNQSLFTANMLIDHNQPTLLKGKGKIRCVFKSIPLLPGVYEIGIRVVGKNRLETFFLANTYSSFGVNAPLVNQDLQIGAGLRHSGPIIVPYEWSY